MLSRRVNWHLGPSVASTTPSTSARARSSSSGSSDVYLTKLDPVTGLATQTFVFGDNGGNDQYATGVAVASNGNVGILGKFKSEIDFVLARRILRIRSLMGARIRFRSTRSSMARLPV